MSDTESIARAYFQTVNDRDWDKLRGMLHAQYSYTGGDGVRLDGSEAAIQVAEMFIGAMSDAKITIDKLHASGDVVVCEFTGTGTHDGDFMGTPASGRKVTMPVCNVLEIRDGKIYAEREYMDMAHMMQQIGAIPAPA